MKYPAYPAYKDSGVEWLGKIPAGWDYKRLKYVAKIVMGQSPLSTDVNQERDGIPFLQGCSEFGDLCPIPRNWCPSPPKIVNEGMILFSVRAPVGELNWADQTLGIGRGLCGIESYKEADFLWHLLASQKEQLQTKITGSTFEAVSVADVGDIAVTFPPLPTQKAIATFLDTETARIDGLIQDYEELIALLQEKRQALISHAVTRGLSELVNPDDPEFGKWAVPVKFKDSGVEWLGKVPEGWEVLRLSRLYREAIETGREDLPILSVSIHSGVSDRELREDELERKVTRSDDREKYKRVEPNDLTYNMMRAWQGGFGAVKTEGMVSPAYVVARPRFSLHSTYFENVLRTPKAIEQMRILSRGVTDFRLRLYWSEFKNIIVPIPPINDQKFILSFLDRETTKIDTLITETQSAIDLLKEHRSALITSAVTGKINVEGIT